MSKNQICAERLFLTEDKSELRREGEDGARFLYASVGDEIPASACERFGIEGGKLKGEGKAKKVPANKERPAPANKSAPVPEGKVPQDRNHAGDPGSTNPAIDAGKDPEAAITDITDIAGIGPATAKALADAGIADVATLAAIDPANAPAIEGLASGFDWAEAVAAAKGGAA